MSKGYVESNLWDYPANVAELEELRYEYDSLKSVECQKYEAHTPNGASDPVSEVVHRRLKLERRMRGLERRIRPVKRLRDDLKQGSEARISQMRAVLKLRYMEHKSHDDVIRQMSVSKATYTRRLRELLRLARKYFGE